MRHLSAVSFLGLRLLPVTAAVLGCPVAHASVEVTSEQWQARAVAEFPSLGVSGSAFNGLFLEQVKVLRQKNPAVLQDPSWPYLLAQRVAVSPELGRALEMLEAKKRTTTESHQESSAQGAVEAVRGDKCAPLAWVCLHAVESELASGAFKEEPAVWIQEGKIAPRLRVRALRSARVVSEAVYSDALQQFAEQVLKVPGDLNEEDLNWVKAVLANAESHAALAGSLGIPELQLVSNLLARADSPGFTLDWLGGGGGGFSPPMQIPAVRRLEVMEKVLEAQFQLGAMHLSKEACQTICFRLNSEVAGGGFLLLERLSVRDFPETCLVNANAPVTKFSPVRREWVAYMQKLIQMHEDLKAGKFPPFSSYFPGCVGSGGFEQFVLWKSLRKDSIVESTAWIDSLAPELYKHSGAQAREARRVLPALNYVLNYQALAEARVTPSAPFLPKPAPVAAARPAATVAAPSKKPVSGRPPAAPATQIRASGN